ncbi:hypothetical protein [uncultured Muribaculum sp.]|uniref:hypothetical protein n=1 Tax=uncultured Muribaculum sp. TaxID=1918613 RepID=UPI0025997167|nr:hypothetical protein [uncultured Muribaculum sp.]
MKKDLIFFSDNDRGLTSTSANHVANMAKEMIRGLEAELETLVFYSTEVSLIGNDSVNTLRRGMDAATVEGTAGKLHQVAQAKSLIAWLREAIKAKERLIKEAEELTLEEYSKIEGITVPEPPKIRESLTADDYFAGLSLDERNRYYQLETLAAVLGKEIHPGGHFADARNDLALRSLNPHEVKGDGRDTLIYSFSPTVESELIESTYFELQKQYREAQSKLNAMKYECEKAVTDSEVKAKTDYAEELDKWNGEMKAIQARRAEYIKKKAREYGSKKILIPQSLEEIYTRVSRLGKDNN